MGKKVSKGIDGVVYWPALGGHNVKRRTHFLADSEPFLGHSLNPFSAHGGAALLVLLNPSVDLSYRGKSSWVGKVDRRRESSLHAEQSFLLKRKI